MEEGTTLSATHPSAGLVVARHRSFSLSSAPLDMVDNRESAYYILPFLLDSQENLERTPRERAFYRNSIGFYKLYGEWSVEMGVLKWEAIIDINHKYRVVRGIMNFGFKFANPGPI